MAVERAFDAARRGPRAGRARDGIRGVRRDLSRQGRALRRRAAALRRQGQRQLSRQPGDAGCPTIQGVLLLADAADGRPLAIMDSGRVTAIRARRPPRPSPPTTSRVATLRCSPSSDAASRAPTHVAALRGVRPIRELRLYDVVASQAEALAARHGDDSALSDRVVGRRGDARGRSRRDLHERRSIRARSRAREPGTFVAAVGVDNPCKREIHPSLMGAARVVVDDLAQCTAGGDLHHAIEAGTMTSTDVHADLASVVVGRHAASRRRRDRGVRLDRHRPRRRRRRGSRSHERARRCLGACGGCALLASTARRTTPRSTFAEAAAHLDARRRSLSFGGPAGQIAVSTASWSRRSAGSAKRASCTRCNTACCCRGPRPSSWRRTSAGGCTAGAAVSWRARCSCSRAASSCWA